MRDELVTLQPCPRCGGIHKDVIATPFEQVVEGWTHWVRCPVTKKVIVIAHPKGYGQEENREQGAG